MTSQQLFQRYQTYLLDLPSVGFRIDISRMFFTSTQLLQLEADALGAISSMLDLERGALCNPDEGRMVGHYWLRAPELAPDERLTQQIVAAQEQVKLLAQEIHAGVLGTPDGETFTDVLLIGIGGSALGPQLVSDALAHASDCMQLHFLDNTDPDGMDRVFRKLGNRLATTLTLVISKSGGTPETRNGMLEAQAQYQQQGLMFPGHAVAVTQEGSALYQQAKREGWLAIFPMWDWVGGRTSVTSTVGLLPAALQGLDVDGLLAGAAEMDRLTRVRTVRENPAALLAMMWHVAGEGRGKRDMVILPYKDRLLLLSRYLQQLIMESLGKEKDLEGRTVHQGISVYGNKGSTDQHAYVQQLREGLDNFFATFIEVLHDRDGASLELSPGVTSGDFLQGFLLGTRDALYEMGRGSITLTLDRVDAHRLGAMIALFERAVGLYAFMVGINAYHQPGVEAGKKAAAAVLTLQQKLLQQLAEGTQETAEALAAAVGVPEKSETALKVLEHLAANGRIRRTEGLQPWDAVFSALV
ncbi:MAG: glucose-6-phosphate isomerase [Myxococcota bacterium]